jgi:hypothetical protein
VHASSRWVRGKLNVGFVACLLVSLACWAGLAYLFQLAL